MRGRALLFGPFAVVVLLVAVAGCGGDDEPLTTSTTTTAGATTTTAAAGDALGEEPPFHDDGPSGSGCTPGSDELPDGWWYGQLIRADGQNTLFDLACYYTGPAAEAEAARRGEEVDNDHYVVDDNPADRAVTIAEDATASCVELGAGLQMADCTPDDVAGDWNVWIRVVDGEVDRLVEQYAP
jgi:hypothetical protein